jgi:hypothetical protein
MLDVGYIERAQPLLLCRAAKSEAGAAGVCAIPCAAISAAVISALAMVLRHSLLGSTFHFGRYEYRALLI